MQKEKMELQQKFNDIVLENKTLKERALTYEPRIREIDGVKQQLLEAHKNSHDIRQVPVVASLQYIPCTHATGVKLCRCQEYMAEYNYRIYLNLL